MKAINFPMTPQRHQKISRLSQELGISMKEVIGRAVDQYQSSNYFTQASIPSVWAEPAKGVKNVLNEDDQVAKELESIHKTGWTPSLLKRLFGD